jgi:hypothetical protein
MSKLRVVSCHVTTFVLLLTCVFLACSPREKRDISTPEKAVLGHWVTHEGAQKVNYYIGDSKIISAIGGRTIEMDYYVLDSSDDENWITLRIDMGEIGTLDKRLSFSKDRKSITEAMEVFGNPVTNRWKYVDSKTAP